MSFISKKLKAPPRKVTIKDIWKIGLDRAKNPSRFTRFKHSGFVRRNRKPGALAKNVVSMAGAAIPIPGASAALGLAYDKVLAEWKNDIRKAKIAGYSSAESDWMLEKKVKHTIKDLNVEKLDRSRAKVKSSIEDLNKLLNDASWTEDHNFCNYRADVAHAYCYLEKRIDLLDARAAVFERVAQDARKWASKQREELLKSHKRCEEILNANEDPQFCENCEDFCVRPSART